MQVLREKIVEEFQTLAFAKEAFPMMIDWGTEDFSLTIHSLGCNYLSALGRHLGFWAMSEYPVRIIRKGTGEALRPDVVWWSKPQGHAMLIGEFERYDPSQPHKLLNKAQHLLHVHRELGQNPRVLLLMTWALLGTDLNVLQKARSIGHDGFRTPRGVVVSGIGGKSIFVVAAAVFGRSENMLKLQRITL
jgi:hypothetical protein